MSSPQAHPTEAQLRRRGARRALIRRSLIVVVLAFAVFVAFHVMQKDSAPTSPHVATKLVTTVSSEVKEDGVHVTARLDAPSPGGTSHQLEGVVPRDAWKLSHTVWACYPPGDPDKGILRTLFDADCATLVAGS